MDWRLRCYSVLCRTFHGALTWKYKDPGQIGDGTSTTRTTPTEIGSGNNWPVIAAGREVTLTIKTDGTLWALGNNDDMALGDGIITDSDTLVLVLHRRLDLTLHR